MLCLRKNKYHIAAALLTAVLLCPCSENFNKTSNLLAWWGTIYPQFCFMEAPRTENGQKAEPRFHFWIVDTLNALRRYCSQKTLRGMLPVNRNVGTLNALM